MRNLIIFLSTFTLTVLLGIFMSAPANASGAGGSWGCPDGWTTKPDGSCSFDGGGGDTGGGGAGGSWGGSCRFDDLCGGDGHSSPSAAAAACIDAINDNGNNPGHFVGEITWISDNRFLVVGKRPPNSDFLMPGTCDAPVDPDVPNPDFPDVPLPNPDCNVCQSLYEIKLKLNVLKNQDIKIINQTIYDMSQKITNIDNSINSLNVEMNTVNNTLTTINNNMGDLITNIENNNITNNEILNTVNNIDNSITEYSLRLGNIELALGDIDVKLDNTNKLVLDLGLDIDFIKNNLVNGSPDSKDYTDQLNEIIELLKSCEPTEEKPCPDDEVVKKLKEIQDYMQADFVPDTDSTAVEVEDLTDIELDRNLIKFGVAQCPPDNEFSTMVNGFSFSGGFKHKPLCDFFTLLSPFIKAFGGFSAALILGGGLRRG